MLVFLCNLELLTIKKSKPNNRYLEFIYSVVNQLYALRLPKFLIHIFLLNKNFENLTL